MDAIEFLSAQSCAGFSRFARPHPYRRWPRAPADERLLRLVLDQRRGVDLFLDPLDEQRAGGAARGHGGLAGGA